jgi:hypothetical protein
MKRLILIIGIVISGFIVSQAQVEQTFTDEGAVSLHNDAPLVSTDSDLSFKIAYFPTGSDPLVGLACYMSRPYKYTVEKGATVLLKFGNGEIVTHRTYQDTRAVYEGEGKYRVAFAVIEKAYILRNMAEHGLVKIRLVSGKDKLDWIFPEDETKKVASDFINFKYAATVAELNNDF